LKILRLVAGDPEDRRIADDLAVSAEKWLGDNYTVALEPGFPESWYYYYLHSLARGCVVAPARPAMGGKDWYNDMADSLIALQQPDGQWSSAADAEASDVVHTSFALLALCRADAVPRRGEAKCGGEVLPAAADRRGRAAGYMKRRVRRAGFPAVKTLREFDFSRLPAISPTVVRRLANGDYLAKKENIILIGDSGTGKTHLATALGVCACNRGFRVKFCQAFLLANQLVEAQMRRQSAKLIKRLSRMDLLIIDELSYFELSRLQAELLFQVLSARHGRGSTIITTNLGLDRWASIWGGSAITDVLVGRIRRQSYVFHTGGSEAGEEPTNLAKYS